MKVFIFSLYRRQIPVDSVEAKMDQNCLLRSAIQHELPNVLFQPRAVVNSDH